MGSRIRVEANMHAKVPSTLLMILLALATAMPVAAASKEQERNKATARDFFEEILPRGDWDGYLRIHAPDFVAHAGRKSVGLQEDLGYAKGWHQAFPDLALTVTQTVAERNRVAVYWTARGTNSGEGNGLPATGRTIDATGITIFRFADGVIAEEWGVMDEYTMLRQLGLMPER
jgi:steroid delta-isomerase-like uncharacterized protein